MSSVAITTVATETEFVSLGVELLREGVTRAIGERGRCILGLSGGSTPRPIYDELGAEKGVDWSRVWIFLADDRYVRPDSPKSNQFLLRSTLLRHAPIPESQIVVPDTTLPYEESVTLYDAHLRSLLGKAPADIVTLGLGEDGHIASLFPTVGEGTFPSRRGGISLPYGREKEIAIGTFTDRFDIPQRISVTLPVLASARERLFFLRGKAKQKAWEEMMHAPKNLSRWPAHALLDERTRVLLGPS